MAQKFLKKQSNVAPVSVPMPVPEPVPVTAPTHNLCKQHGKPLDVICITCKERICSNCALFGNHKGHDVRAEQEVLDQINLRTECLMEMY